VLSLELGARQHVGDDRAQVMTLLNV